MKHYSAAALERLATEPLRKEADLLALIRARLDATQAGKARLAASLGIAEAELSRILRGHMRISAPVAEKLGFRMITRFEKIS